MALTPVEIRHLTPSTGFIGYNRTQTDSLLAEIAASFEDVWRERADLADKVEQLETDLVRYRELESLLRTTLVSAERASADVKESARREADLILGEAHAEARKIQRDSIAEHERLVTESRRLRAQLRAALETIEDVPAAEARDEDEDDGQGTWPGAREAA
jgi:cell division initiation protein